MSAIERELSRRGFLAAAGAATVTLAQALSLTDAAAAGLQPPPLLPHGDAVRVTTAAYLDTIVPGPAGGADAAPGALEAGALDVVYDPAYGTSIVLPMLHEDLQLTSLRMTGKPFDLSLPYPDRERIVANRMRSTGRYGADGDPWILVYAGVAIVAYVAYYGTARSELGPRYIGFPPRATRYRDHSYDVSFRTMTKNGNPR